MNNYMCDFCMYCKLWTFKIELTLVILHHNYVLYEPRILLSVIMHGSMLQWTSMISMWQVVDQRNATMMEKIMYTPYQLYKSHSLTVYTLGISLRLANSSNKFQWRSRLSDVVAKVRVSIILVEGSASVMRTFNVFIHQACIYALG